MCQPHATDMLTKIYRLGCADRDVPTKICHPGPRCAESKVRVLEAQKSAGHLQWFQEGRQLPPKLDGTKGIKGRSKPGVSPLRHTNQARSWHDHTCQRCLNLIQFSSYTHICIKNQGLSLTPPMLITRLPCQRQGGECNILDVFKLSSELKGHSTAI